MTKRYRTTREMAIIRDGQVSPLLFRIGLRSSESLRPMFLGTNESPKASSHYTPGAFSVERHVHGK